jgi:hypothetical protein
MSCASRTIQSCSVITFLRLALVGQLLLLLAMLYAQPLLLVVLSYTIGCLFGIIIRRRTIGQAAQERRLLRWSPVQPARRWDISLVSFFLVIALGLTLQVLVDRLPFLRDLLAGLFTIGLSATTYLVGYGVYLARRHREV